MKQGSYGYINHMKMKTAILTIAIFAAAVLTYLILYFFFPEHKTMIGIVAVLITIPGAMAMVRFILFARVKEGDREIFETIEKERDGLPVYYDAILTTSEKSYPVNAFIACENDLLGYSAYKGTDTAKIEKHLDEIYKNNMFKDMNIKVFTDRGKFLERLSTLTKRERKDSGMEGKVLHLLERITL